VGVDQREGVRFPPLKFSQWFDAYRTTTEAPGANREDDDAELSADQRAEIDRRLDALDADPSLAVPWEGTMDEVRKIRESLRTQKAADRRV
jgi:hypothetical protein